MILCRSRYTFQGNYRREDLTEKDLPRDGWYNTGDIGLITSGDELVLKGRITDMIPRGINSIIPSLLEDITMEIPSVQRVSVIAVPEIIRRSLCLLHYIRQTDNSRRHPEIL
ncbi:hypothetical protein KUTeg_019735 [Tegillarca granosa]|uniref:AMP-dependent synthetase/ligase domain-containing protein n=1 Tax=Tegillarca granosa TaxID=220873 RepID=A0ABQ9EDG8_TEGGR|nr:hypothetical protein KUTeg_019735 [Tegillarca granosa]